MTTNPSPAERHQVPPMTLAQYRAFVGDDTAVPPSPETIAPAPIHYQTSASDVRCGAPMRHWRDQPDGWDLGTVTVDGGQVTCPACLWVPAPADPLPAIIAAAFPVPAPRPTFTPGQRVTVRDSDDQTFAATVVDVGRTHAVVHVDVWGDTGPYAYALSDITAAPNPFAGLQCFTCGADLPADGWCVNAGDDAHRLD